METKFVVKVQKIGGFKQNELSSFSAPLVIEPADSLTTKKGCLYSVIELTSTANFDPGLVAKIITDELQNGYFAETEGTPLQSLEKTITVVKEKVLNLFMDPRAVSQPVVDFQTVMSILWGNVLYVVQFGRGCSYLIRDGRIKPINTLSEGDFSITSGMVRDGDIVILGSEGFCQNNPPETLLKGVTSFMDKPEVAATILKFHVERDADFDKQIDIRDVSKEGLRVNRNQKKKNRILALVGMVVLVLALITSSYFAFRKNDQVSKKEATQIAVSKSKSAIDEASKLIGTDDDKARALLAEAKKELETAKAGFSTAEVDELLAKSSQKLDEVNKVKKPSEDSDVLYDFRVEDKDASPSEIALSSDSTILAVDYSRSKFYKFAFGGAASASILEATQAAKPKFLNATESGAVFMGEDYFYSFDGGNNKFSRLEKKPEFSQADALAASSYIGNTYAIVKNTILKNNTEWSGTDSALSDSISMTVDGDIYILTKSGSVIKYNSGVKKTFEIKGLEVAMKDPVQIITSPDFKNLYVLDKGNSRVVAINKEGKLSAQYPLKGDSQDYRSITVTKDEKTLYVLSGSKLYKISL